MNQMASHEEQQRRERQIQERAQRQRQMFDNDPIQTARLNLIVDKLKSTDASNDVLKIFESFLNIFPTTTGRDRRAIADMFYELSMVNQGNRLSALTTAKKIIRGFGNVPGHMYDSDDE